MPLYQGLASTYPITRAYTNLMPLYQGLTNTYPITRVYSNLMPHYQDLANIYPITRASPYMTLKTGHTNIDTGHGGVR